MIIGSGMLATAFSPHFADSKTTWVYAAGVSNSRCTSPGEFERERARLAAALERAGDAQAFVYFGTCSVTDPISARSQYVMHKLAMERLVSQHPAFLVVRLPQVAGRTPNPHTFLNYLYGRISRSEGFEIWRHATRNVIDVDDVARLAVEVLADTGFRRREVNIAATVTYPVPAIVAAMEKVVGKPAVAEWLDYGAPHPIDTSAIEPIARRLGLRFDEGYIDRVIRKYYGGPRA